MYGLRLLREVWTKTYRYEETGESFSGRVSYNLLLEPNSGNVCNSGAVVNLLISLLSTQFLQMTELGNK